MSSQEETPTLPTAGIPDASISTPTDSGPTTDAAPLLSKNARKRLLKAEWFAASKAERRARDKEKKRERAEKRRAGDPDALEDAEQRKAKRRKVESAKLAPKKPFKARVVIDLAFDDKMSEKEVVSLCSQLAYTYSSNRKSRTPFDALLCTSLNGKTLERLTALGDNYKRWHGVEFWEDGYDRLWSDETGDKTQQCSKESVVYLTGDAEDELEKLKEGETYIIGGICDRNRYKNLCLNKAQEQSIRSARLPIGTYLANLPTRKILTVNQVFDILLHWVEEKDWSKALYTVMPKRKFQQGSQGGGGSSVQDAHEEAESNIDGGTDGNADEGAESETRRDITLETATGQE